MTKLMNRKEAIQMIHRLAELNGNEAIDFVIRTVQGYVDQAKRELSSLAIQHLEAHINHLNSQPAEMPAQSTLRCAIEGIRALTPLLPLTEGTGGSN